MALVLIREELFWLLFVVDWNPFPNQFYFQYLFKLITDYSLAKRQFRLDKPKKKKSEVRKRTCNCKSSCVCQGENPKTQGVTVTSGKPNFNASFEIVKLKAETF